MAAYVKTLLDKDNNQILPNTSVGAVSGLQSRLDSIDIGFGNKIDLTINSSTLKIDLINNSNIISTKTVNLPSVTGGTISGATYDTNTNELVLTFDTTPDATTVRIPAGDLTGALVRTVNSQNPDNSGNIAVSATNVPYSNSGTGLTGATVQAAVTELSAQKAAQTVLGTAWVAGTTYNVDDHVMHNGVMYKCKTANSDATWTASNWTVVDFAKETNDKIDSLSSAINDVAKEIGFPINETFTGQLQASSSLIIISKSAISLTGGHTYTLTLTLGSASDNPVYFYFRDSANTTYLKSQTLNAGSLSKSVSYTPDSDIDVLIGVNDSNRAISYTATLVDVNQNSRIDAIVGDIDSTKSALDDYSSYQDFLIPFASGYIATSSRGQLQTTTVTDNASYVHALVDVKAGEQYLITGTPNDNSGTRAYSMASNIPNIGLVSYYRHDSATALSNYLLTIPFDGKLILNFLASSNYSAIRVFNATNKIESLEKDISDYTAISFESGYITTYPVGGINTDYTPTPNSALLCFSAVCKKGDIFTITGTPNDNSATRAYAWYANDGLCVYREDSTNELYEEEITSPCDGTLVVNFAKTYPCFAYKGSKAIVENAEHNRENIDRVKSEVGNYYVGFLEGYYIPTAEFGITVNLTRVPYSGTASAIIDCNKNDRFVISGTPNDNTGTRAYMFVHNNGSRWISLGRYDGTSKVTNMEIVAPMNGKLVVNFKKDEPYSLMYGFKNINKSLADVTDKIDELYKIPLTSLPSYVFRNFTERKLGELDKPYICMTTDDGWEDGTNGVATYTVPLAISKNVPFTFALMHDSQCFQSETYTNIVLDAVENHGCAISQHGSNTWANLTEEELVQFFESEKTFFENLGLTLKSAAYPMARVSDMARAVAGGLYGVVRAAWIGGKDSDPQLGPSDYVYNVYDWYTNGPQTNMYSLTSFNITDKNITLADAKKAVDYAVEHNLLVITHFHEFELDAEKKTKIEDFIDYAKAQGMTFITLDRIQYLPTGTRYF